MIMGRRSPLLAACCVAGPLLIFCQWNLVLAFRNYAFFTGKPRLGGRRVWRRTRAQNRGVARLPRRVAAAEDEAGGDAGEMWSDYSSFIIQRPIDRILLDEGRGLRVHCLSDLHTDYKSNLAWVKTWPSWKGTEMAGRGEGHEDVLMVAGDVSSSLERLLETLTDLKKLYDQVFFVVGNHDLWTRSQRKPSGGEDASEEQEQTQRREEHDLGSVGKLVQIHQACEVDATMLAGSLLPAALRPMVERVNAIRRLVEAAAEPTMTSMGVRTNPAVFVLGGSGGGEEEGTSVGGIGERGRQEVGVFPLLSWYHASWDDEPDLPPEDQFRNGNFFRRWGDFAYCRWPASICSREDFVTVSRDARPVLANFFARQNDACIEAFRASKEKTRARAGGASSSTVISFSHFVPRQQLCPEKRFLSEPNLTKAIGSVPLERQVRELGSDLHVFGHTHIPIDMVREGVRYLQWPLGSVAEQSRQCKKMREQGPLVVYSHDGRTGGLSPQVSTFWGDYYRTYPRDVRETFVPEWALKRIRGRRRSDRPAASGTLASDE